MVKRLTENKPQESQRTLRTSNVEGNHRWTQINTDQKQEARLALNLGLSGINSCLSSCRDGILSSRRDEMFMETQSQSDPAPLGAGCFAVNEGNRWQTPSHRSTFKPF